jgi:hypothetical protein
MEVGQGPNWGCSANGKKKLKKGSFASDDDDLTNCIKTCQVDPICLTKSCNNRPIY